MTIPNTPLCALCAIDHLLGTPLRNCCNAKIEQGHNVSCSTCFSRGKQHLCFLLDPLGMKSFDRVMALKHDGDATFPEYSEEFQVILLCHLSILNKNPTPIKTWTLSMPAETFAGASMLVKFGKGVLYELPDDPHGKEHSDVETATTIIDQAINEPEYFIVDDSDNDKSGFDDEDWVAV